MSRFKDHFSEHADAYRAHRPTYPVAIFDWLRSLTPSNQLAVDVGCGNGQASVALTSYFDRVVAIDPSDAQIRRAETHKRIHYEVSPAERIPLTDHVADLVIAAQAAHWFDLQRFYAEVMRVLRPGGVLAIWCYQTLELDHPADAVIRAFYRQKVGAYWPPERHMVDDGYAQWPFPFDEIQAPDFQIRIQWDLQELLDYIRTWSAVQRFIQDHLHDPTDELADTLGQCRLGPLIRVRFPVRMRVGRLMA